MAKMTEDNLRSAFAGESQAHMRYLAFAARAEREQKPNVSRLFRAIAYAEEVHATNHLRTLGGIQSTSDNLKAAIDGENFEVEEMYPAYLAVARLQGQDQAQRSMNYAFEAEKIHSQLYSEAKGTVDAGRDLALEKIFVCSVCGHVALGEAPERCPICNARKESYRGF